MAVLPMMMVFCVTADWEMQCNQPQAPWSHVGLYTPAWHKVESHGLLSPARNLRLQSWLIEDVKLAVLLCVFNFNVLYRNTQIWHLISHTCISACMHTWTHTSTRNNWWKTLIFVLTFHMLSNQQPTS
jgi:hypothetical protein